MRKLWGVMNKFIFFIVVIVVGEYTYILKLIRLYTFNMYSLLYGNFISNSSNSSSKEYYFIG